MMITYTVKNIKNRFEAKSLLMGAYVEAVRIEHNTEIRQKLPYKWETKHRYSITNCMK